MFINYILQVKQVNKFWRSYWEGQTAFHFAELNYMEITIWATAIYFKWVYTPDHAYDSG